MYRIGITRLEAVRASYFLSVHHQAMTRIALPKSSAWTESGTNRVSSEVILNSSEALDVTPYEVVERSQ